MAIQRFVIQVPELQLEDLARRLKTTRWPQYKESWSWERGSDKTYLNSLLEYWKDQYDWRKEEKTLNEFSQFKCEIDGATIHFSAVLSTLCPRCTGSNTGIQPVL
jgi:hypothetical protein